MRALIWRMGHIESLDRARSTKPAGIARYREYDRTVRRYDGAWGVFVTVEAGDDASTAKWLATVTHDFERKEPTGRVVVLPFAHLSNNLAAPEVSLPILETSVAALRGLGLTVERITFGTSKWLRWDIAWSALTGSYVENGPTEAPRPVLSGMFLKLSSLTLQAKGGTKHNSNLVAATYSQTSGAARRHAQDLVDRLEELRKKQFYEVSRFVVVPLALGDSRGPDPKLSKRIVHLASGKGWRAFDLPPCEHLTLELAGQPADASYFEFPRMAPQSDSPAT